MKVKKNSITYLKVGLTVFVIDFFADAIKAWCSRVKNL